ncbi:nucleotidyltransferase domain-containing protein [archaeon]|nr:nucleotidyltransferase domain-containing protein [archaeon]
MLKIINDLEPFFGDCYARISIRQYSRLMKITPPTASTLLKYYEKEGLLLKKKDRNYIMFHANKGSQVFICLSRVYWSHILRDLAEFVEKKTVSPSIVLFGSLSKAEVKPDSDIDLAIFTHSKKIDLSYFEKKLKRKIQVFWHASVSDICSKELSNNIMNGHILAGRLMV